MIPFIWSLQNRKNPETENRLIVAREEEKGGKLATTNGYGFSLKLVKMKWMELKVAQFCEYTKSQWIVHEKDDIYNI
jgi:hypothetical protein